jgi:hypothetical protein
VNIYLIPLCFRMYVPVGSFSCVLNGLLIIAIVCKKFVINYCNHMYLNCVTKVTEFKFVVKGLRQKLLNINIHWINAERG